MFRRLSIILLSTSMLMTAPVHAEPLPALARDLLQEHPQIQAARYNIKAAKAGKQEAFSGYLPKVDTAIGVGYASVDRQRQRPASFYRDDNTGTRSVTYTHNIFDGLRTTAGYDAAKANLSVAELALSQTEQLILLEAVIAYMDVLRQIELASLSADNVENLRKQLALEDARVERGSGIAVDVLQSKTRLQIALERQAAFSGAMRDAKARYKQVFGEEPDLSNMRLPNIPQDRMPESLEAALTVALENNFDIIINRYNVDIAQYSRKGARGGYMPMVDILSGYYVDNNVSGVDGMEQRATATVNTSWNLFNGLADQSRIRRAAANYESAQENLHYAMRKTDEAVKLAWSALVTNKERVDLLDNAVNIAGEVLDSRYRLRDAGKDTAMNVLDSENEVFRARIDAASARYDYYNAMYRLLQSMGTLDPRLVTDAS